MKGNSAYSRYWYAVLAHRTELLGNSVGFQLASRRIAFSAVEYMVVCVLVGNEGHARRKGKLAALAPARERLGSGSIQRIDGNFVESIFARAISPLSANLQERGFVELLL
jgi:hypothetical protein